jgi:hypothetical protein
MHIYFKILNFSKHFIKKNRPGVRGPSRQARGARHARARPARREGLAPGRRGARPQAAGPAAFAIGPLPRPVFLLAPLAPRPRGARPWRQARAALGGYL